MKSLDEVAADVTVIKEGLRLLFPFHSPRILKMDKAVLYKELSVQDKVRKFEYSSFYVWGYKKTVVLILKVPEGDHKKATLDRLEFVKLLKGDSLL